MNDVPYPRPGWLFCPICGGDPVIRCWQFHRRPGKPTVPYRCDVHVKCGSCAFGWWHGVAIAGMAWLRRPKPYGLRKLLTSGSSFEPKVWAGDRGQRR